jgi:hypothetical protein
VHLLPVRFPTALLLLVGLVLGSTAALSAQAAPEAPPASGAAAGVLTGRILKYGAGVPAAEVTLHQVTPQASGVASVQTTGPDGGFRFDLPPAADPAGFNVFFVTVDYLGVRYFGEPVHANQPPPGYAVQVYDTTAAVPGAVHVGRRDIILFPETDGSWSANELIRAVNETERTFVSQGGEPTWEFVLPEGALDFEVTEGMAGPDELRVVGERVVFVGSLPPGTRELFVRYRLGGNQTSMSLATVGRTDTLSVYLPEQTPGVRVSGLMSTQVITADGERFVRYSSTDLGAGHAIGVTWRSTRPPVDPVWAALAVAIAILAAGTWLALRNAGRPALTGREAYRAPVPPTPSSASEPRPR